MSEEQLEPKEFLKQLCSENAEYFVKDSSENGQRLYISLLAIKESLDQSWPTVTHIREIAPKYDFDENTPGNGFRSFIGIYDAAITYAIELNKRVDGKKDSVLFQKSLLTKYREIESCAHLFASLSSCFDHLVTLISWNNEGELFPKEDHTPEEILAQSDTINQYCFYGRCLGFQFRESMRNILKFIMLSMAVFSEAYYSEGSVIAKATNSIVTTTKYIKDPDEQAKRIVNISQNADINFCKSFWFLSELELMYHLPSVVAQNVAVSKIIELPPEPLTIKIGDKEIEVPIPTSHIGRKPICVRLISYEVREGMIGEAAQKAKMQPPARGLLIHCHGGGFVAQSSRSHECYLRLWAKILNVPILSIDYSLAPGAPYPRAIEEVLYAYGWALKNCDLLGSTGESVVAAGDSAGANLLLATSLKCIEMGLPLPKGLFIAYVPTLVDFVPSPSRLLCMMDPLLPFGFLLRCLKAYTCKEPTKVLNGDPTSDSESFEEISESDLMELQAHKSPISETSDTLTCGSLNSQLENDQREKIDLPPDLLQNYILDSDTDTDATRIPSQESCSTPQSFGENVRSRFSSFISNLKGHFESLVPKITLSSAVRILDIERERSAIEEFKTIQVPKDPFISPYLASDELLKQLPPIKILTVQLDPCLDDCVMFGKRLKKLGHNVTLDVLEGLPHGFLNFSLLSKDALEGSKLCAKRIQELMCLDELPPKQ